MDQPKGFIDYVDDTGREVPLEVQTHTIIPPETLAANIKLNLGRNIPRFAVHHELRKRPLAVVGAGPSLRETWPRLQAFADVMVCGSSHDFVVRKGIVPTYAIVCDGGEADKGNLSLPQHATTYLIASQCHPNLYDHLEGYQVQMWHYKGQATPDENAERELLKGEMAVGWGSSVGIVCIQLCQLLGYQYLHFFGLDSCYGREDQAHHACEIEGYYGYQRFPVKVNHQDLGYVSDLALMEQASQFCRLIEAQHQFLECTIHGDGLIAAMIKHGEPGLSQYVRLAE